MPRSPSDIVCFPHDRMTGLVLSNAEHTFLVSLIGPCHGVEVEDFLMQAPAVAGGRRLATNHPAMDLLFESIGIDVHGFMKLEDEEAGRTRLKPKKGGTAERLLAIYQRIELHLS